MPSPFDLILNNIKEKGFHNQRDASHSDLLTTQIASDLKTSCDALAADLASGDIHEWYNVDGPDGRNTDLIIGLPNDDGTSNLDQVRILIEHKSIMTAHRNRSARFQDIEREMLATHKRNPKAIVAATLIVGLCRRVLNVPDCVKKDVKRRKLDFSEVQRRLSSGDQTLWDEFEHCISENTESDPIKTIEKFRGLPVRECADTYLAALDYMLFIPMECDNVSPPKVRSFNGIDPVSDYNKMIRHICQVYKIRWNRKP